MMNRSIFPLLQRISVGIMQLIVSVIINKILLEAVLKVI